MNLIEELFISNSYSETYRSIWFPVLVHVSTVVRDKFNQTKVSLVPASNIVYGVFAADEIRDTDLEREDTRDGNAEHKATVKLVRKDLIEVGVEKLKMGDVLEITINGVSTKYVITSFPHKNELPNIFVRPKVTLLSDVNVGEIPNG